ncbi:MAG: glycosyltransferase [Candidatus Aenigmarchaeota archaeon]|nr:glycosyltransferase [Candidatus Aenigmarchaeota archaeon]
MNTKIGLIPAAGRGVRVYPKTRTIPKVMLDIGGKPILQRNIEIMRDQLGIKDIYIAINYLGHIIKNYFGDGSKFGVNITYVTNNDMKKGLVNSIYVMKDYIKSDFFVILGDEIYVDSNHSELLKLSSEKPESIIGIKKGATYSEIKKNYSVEIKGNKITSLVEKPEKIINDYAGCGTYYFSKNFFDYIEKTPKSKKSGIVELTGVIDTMAKESNVLPFYIEGNYVNVNTTEDLNYANYMWKDLNFDKYKVTVIIPALNEEKTIGDVIDDYTSSKYVDEVFVVDTNSTDATDKIAKEHGAKVVTKGKVLSGYGEKLKYAMDITKNDIIILTEADGSFRSKDIPKMLEYLKDADMVIGTRTTRQMIEQGANMDWFLRWGNLALGKLIEVLWWNQEPRFTDVGCTYRAIWKDSFERIKNNLEAKGPNFSPEMMIEILKAKRRVIEIPVSYYMRRGGESKHSKNKAKIIKTGLKMLKIIIKKRFLT